MKKLYLLLITLCASVALNAQVLNVPTIEQEQENWCWAGVSKCMLDYYGNTLQQCEIADYARTTSTYYSYGNTPCCDVPDGACDQYNQIYGYDGSIESILSHFADIESDGVYSSLTEAQIQADVANNRTSVMRWGWTAGGGHFLVIHGYVNGNVYYMDPWFGEGKKIATYNTVKSGNDGTGSHNWTHTLYITSDVTVQDTIPCEFPTNLSANVSGTTVSLNWAVVASAQSYIVRYREQGTSNWTLEENISGNSIAISSLQANTDYEFQVASKCNQVSFSDFSGSVNATTGDAPLIYCNSRGNNVSGDWIKSVAFGSINNTSNANSGYADFTALSTSITAGTSANITLTPGFASSWWFGTTTQPEYWSVWIDLNQDGDFTDANEQRYASIFSSTSAVSAAIAIPSGTPAGTTRMRIAMKRNASATSCESFAYGEVEDYSINIIADVPPTCDEITNLAISNATNTSLTVSWSASANASSYDLDYRPAGGSWTTVSTASTSYNLTGLTAETTYEVKVSTVCSFGNSEYSSTVSATTDADPICEVVSNLTVANITNTSLTASWNAASNGDSYNVEYRSVGGSWITANTAATSYNINGLNAETSYEVRVSTVCSFGVSEYSSTVSATTAADPVCEIVSNLALANITNTSLTASWSAASNGDSYNVEYRSVGGSWIIANTDATSYNISGLSAETTYDVRVSTVCSFGTSEYSNTVSATTDADPICEAPSNLNATSISQTSATLNWSSVSGATGFVLEYKELSAGTWNSISNASTGYVLNGLVAETEYLFRVSTECDAANSEASSEELFITEAAPLVVEYCNASGTNSANEWIQAVTIGSTTNTSGNNGGYGNYTSTIFNLTPGASTYIQLNPGFPYSWFWGYSTQPEYWIVWIDYNKDGDFDDANEIAAQSNGTFTGVVSGNFNVATGVTGTTRMRIAMKRSTAANSCGNYTYGEVEDYTVDFGGGSAQLNQGSAVSVATLTNHNQLATLVYPNPATDVTTLEITIPANNALVSAELMDYTGRVITQYSWASSNNEQLVRESIDVSHLPKGFYLIQIETKLGEKIKHKLMVR